MATELTSSPDLVVELRERARALGYVEEAICRTHARWSGRHVTGLDEFTDAELFEWLNIMDFAVRRGAAGI